MITHQITNSYGNYNCNAYIYTGISIDAHFHGNYELIYAMEGDTDVRINGAEETLKAGEMILISPYTIHALNIGDSVKAWVGVFSEDFISAFAAENRHARYSKFRCDGNTERMLKERLFVEEQQRRYVHMAYLYLVCDQCAKNAAVSKAGQDAVFVRRVVEYIAENLSDSISMKELSKALNYEYHYFSSLFHQYLGMNFKGFLNLFRFESACKLLADKKTGITEVSSSCGFGSIRNFNRVFKSICGYTPREYKKLMENE